VRIGVHVSVALGLPKAARHAAALGCECLQIFGRNARGWRGRAYPAQEIDELRDVLNGAGISPLVLHSSYLVNLASPDRELRRRSIDSVADDMARAAALGAACVTVHFGHHMGAGLAAGIRRVASAARALLRDGPVGVALLLENSAGRGTELGSEWEHFLRVLDLLAGHPRLGVCFDTCHAHAAGHRLDGPRHVARALRAFAAALGISRLRLIHLNDSKAPAGSRIDLHQHIGRGTIGDAGFRSLLRRRELRGSCAILETPMRRPHDDRRNLRRVSRLRGPASV
jgi:deoxyribonuclease-4